MKQVNIDGRLRIIQGLETYCVSNNMPVPDKKVFPLEAIEKQQIPLYFKILKHLVYGPEDKENKPDDNRSLSLDSPLLNDVMDRIEYLCDIASEKNIDVRYHRKMYDNLCDLFEKRNLELIHKDDPMINIEGMCFTESSDEERNIRSYLLNEGDEYNYSDQIARY
jgi:hypothetical protein